MYTTPEYDNSFDKYDEMMENPGADDPCGQS